MSNFTLVITSIALAENKVLQLYSSEAKRRNVSLILIGDRKSPENFSLTGAEFYAIEQQKKLPFKLAKALPENHYARKNIGYLIAIQNGAEVIVETDDDNLPYESFWQPRKLTVENARVIENKGWINIYSYFTDKKIWPRGFPLEYVNQPQAAEEDSINTIKAPIQQGLADENPDVDAVYRMTGDLPVKFEQKQPVALGRGSFSPFNSQNTTWFRQAFPLLYLPSYCSFRMTDIWRSFVASRIAQEYGWFILFHSSTVFQERNEHNLLRDFEQEIPGYLNNARIMEALLETDLCSDEQSIFENLMRLYETLVHGRWIEEKELHLLEAWIDDLIKLGL